MDDIDFLTIREDFSDFDDETEVVDPYLEWEFVNLEEQT